jgi:hypothetical protein
MKALIAMLLLATPALAQSGQSEAETKDKIRAACAFMYDQRTDPNQFAYCLAHFPEAYAAYKRAHGG